MFRTGLIVLAISASAAAAAAQMPPPAPRYADQKCSVCHSIAGKGNAKGALDNVGSKPADEIRAWITDAKSMTEKTKAPRKPVMKQYSLPQGDVDALVAYMQTLKK